MNIGFTYFELHLKQRPPLDFLQKNRGRFIKEEKGFRIIYLEKVARIGLYYNRMKANLY